MHGFSRRERGHAPVRDLVSQSFKETNMSASSGNKMNAVRWLACAAGFVATLAPSEVRAEPKVAAATAATVTKTATPGAATTTTTTTVAPAKEVGATGRTTTPMGVNVSDAIGGHVGVAVPLITLQGYTTSTYAAAPLNKTQTVSDQFTLAFPIGVTVRTSRRFAVDLEITVQTSVHPTGATTLTVDPGVIYDWGPVATGLRLAVPIGAEPAAIGFIPLVNRGITRIGGALWFVEADFPILYHGSGAPVAANTTGTNSRVEFNAVLHTGFGF
jgi:hypothetical protein